MCLKGLFISCLIRKSCWIFLKCKQFDSWFQMSGQINDMGVCGSSFCLPACWCKRKCLRWNAVFQQNVGASSRTPPPPPDQTVRCLRCDQHVGSQVRFTLWNYLLYSGWLWGFKKYSFLGIMEVGQPMAHIIRWSKNGPEMRDGRLESLRSHKCLVKIFLIWFSPVSLTGGLKRTLVEIQQRDSTSSLSTLYRSLGV